MLLCTYCYARSATALRIDCGHPPQQPTSVGSVRIHQQRHTHDHQHGPPHTADFRRAEPSPSVPPSQHLRVTVLARAGYGQLPDTRRHGPGPPWFEPTPTPWLSGTVPRVAPLQATLGELLVEASLATSQRRAYPPALLFLRSPPLSDGYQRLPDEARGGALPGDARGSCVGARQRIQPRFACLTGWARGVRIGL